MLTGSGTSVRPELAVGLRVHVTRLTHDGPRSVAARVGSTTEGCAELLLGEDAGLVSGQDVTLSYASGTGLVEFESTVLSTAGGDRAPVTVSVPGEARRVQRRDFVRIGVAAPICLLLPRPGGQGQEEAKGRTRDLSGGGAAVLIGARTPPARAREVAFAIDCEPGLSVAGVAAVIEVRPQDRNRSLLRLRFTQIREVDRDALTAWIFRQQVRVRS